MPNKEQENNINEELQALFGGSFDSNEIVTTKRSGETSALDRMRAEALKERKKVLAKHGVNMRFATAKTIGKNEKGEVIRKAEIMEGNFLFKLCKPTKETPIPHLKAVELDPTLAGTCKYYVTPKIELLNDKGEVIEELTTDIDLSVIDGFTS